MFKPINDAHAISEVVIYFELGSKLSEGDIKELEDLKIIFRKELPSSEDLVNISVAAKSEGMDITDAQFKQSKSGFELKRFNTHTGTSKRTLEWVLRITDHIISVHCLSYIRWAPFKDEALKYIEEAFKKLNLSGSGINSIALKYIDRFIFEGDPSNCSFDKLFSKDSFYLNSTIFTKNDPRWHNHIGWFENYEEKMEILNQLNIDAGFFDTPDGEKIHSTNIDHNSILAHKEDEPIFKSFPLKSNIDEWNELTKYIDSLHIFNKKVMGNMLTSNMVSEISLEESSDESSK